MNVLLRSVLVVLVAMNPVCRQIASTALAALATLGMVFAAPFATPAQAFDGEWSGFLLGASIGAGGTSGQLATQFDEKSSPAWSTGVRFGYVFGRYAVSFMSHTTWSDYESGTLGLDGISMNGNLGFHGLVVSRTSSRRLLPFPIAGIGYTTWRDIPLFPDAITYVAPGFLAGVGVEPLKHFPVELLGYRGFPGEGDFSAAESWSMQLVVTATAY